MKNIYTSINFGEFEGKRFYKGGNYGEYWVIWSEFLEFFKYLVNNEIDLYLISTTTKHNIVFNQEDLKYLNQIKKETSNNFIYTENINSLKNFQLEDFLKIFFIKNIEIWVVLPYLYNNKYGYNFLIGFNKNANIDNFLNLNFNLININDYECINKKISYKFIQNLFFFDNFLFKDCLLNKNEELELDFFKKIELLPEYDEYIDLINKCYKYEIENNTKNGDYFFLKNRKNILKKFIFDKKEELYNYDLEMKIKFKKLSYHLYYYNKDIWKNSEFCTNFYDLTDFNKEFDICENEPEFFTSLLSRLSHNHEYLPFIVSDLSKVK